MYAGALPAACPFSESIPLPRTRGRGRGWGQTDHAANVAYFDFAPVPLGIAGYTWDFPTQVNGQPMRCWGIYDTNLLADHRTPAAQAAPGRRDAPPRRRPRERRDPGSSHPLVQPAQRTERAARASWWAMPPARTASSARASASRWATAASPPRPSARPSPAATTPSSDYRRRVLLSPLGLALTVRTAITHILYRLRWAWFQRFFWRVFKPVVAAVSLISC